MGHPGIAELAALAEALIDGLLDRPPDPAALTFLLRYFGATDRDDVREKLGHALTLALTAYHGDTDVIRRAAWLSLFRQATMLSDDERLGLAAGQLAVDIRRDWHSAIVADSMCAIDACLSAGSGAGDSELVSSAVDALERIITHAYDPGEPIGAHADQVRSAAALLTAFEVTGRLPYAMLAEELMQSAKRITEGAEFAIRCETVRVFCRLAALHEDRDYRAAAIVAPKADYRSDATELVATLAPRTADESATYALALSQFLNVTIESDRYGH